MELIATLKKNVLVKENHRTESRSHGRFERRQSSSSEEMKGPGLRKSREVHQGKEEHFQGDPKRWQT